LNKQPARSVFSNQPVSWSDIVVMGQNPPNMTPLLNTKKLPVSRLLRAGANNGNTFEYAEINANGGAIL
jgi:hypothetical protein